MSEIPVFYINVAARTDRRESMEAQFAELGISAERVEAVLPNQIPAAAASMSGELDGTRSISLGDIACTLSHFACWRRAIEYEADACVVLEDDAVIARNFTHLLQELGASLPSGIDVLKLETFRQQVRLGHEAKIADELIAQRLLTTHHGSCGYIISTGLAERLIGTIPLASQAIDGYLFGRTAGLLTSHRIYQMRPALVVQLMHHNAGDVSRSDLGSGRDVSVRRRRMSRWQRIRSNLALAWREYRAFGNEVLNSRELIPFADDAPSS